VVRVADSPFGVAVPIVALSCAALSTVLMAALLILSLLIPTVLAARGNELKAQPPKTPPLTRRQHDILSFYRSYSTERGISPTLEEVAKHFGVNKVTVFGHVAELERKGILSRAGRGISRALQIVEPPSTARPATVNILGSIAAGRPISALEEPEVFELGELVPPEREVYALRVRGESMIDDGIHDGDLVLVERRSQARDGEMVVAILPDEEATLKRLYREKNGYRLQPANKNMQPIHTPELEVRGVVIGLVRKM
jgi:repressor LexA